MDDRSPDTSNDVEFVRQVRDALTCLYDHVHLQRHPLAQRLVPQRTVATRTRAQELRRILLDAIEALNPGDSVPIRAPERRPYAILFGLYVEGRQWQEVANSLSIGGRQLRRDRAAAIEALASILHGRYLVEPATGTEPTTVGCDHGRQHGQRPSTHCPVPALSKAHHLRHHDRIGQRDVGHTLVDSWLPSREQMRGLHAGTRGDK
jgi:hypothetical protein